MCFVLQMKWHPCLAIVTQKLIKSKLSNIRMKKKKKNRSWLKPFLRYGEHKICNFELFCWQHFWFD
ncbi:hypothetical protein O3M35_010985 [Rhynocoris fuscipes]|uniref:Uncharacterized protein n=1 Tax=Rhynocoris fuscipes TaxID=488301 RepID=A0AAW1D124_9HEMI